MPSGQAMWHNQCDDESSSSSTDKILETKWNKGDEVLCRDVKSNTCYQARILEVYHRNLIPIYVIHYPVSVYRKNIDSTNRIINLIHLQF